MGACAGRRARLLCDDARHPGAFRSPDPRGGQASKQRFFLWPQASSTRLVKLRAGSGEKGCSALVGRHAGGAHVTRADRLASRSPSWWRCSSGLRVFADAGRLSTLAYRLLTPCPQVSRARVARRHCGTAARASSRSLRTRSGPCTVLGGCGDLLRAVRRPTHRSRTSRGGRCQASRRRSVGGSCRPAHPGPRAARRAEPGENMLPLAHHSRARVNSTLAIEEAVQVKAEADIFA